MKKVIFDIGYSATKYSIDGERFILPSAVCSLGLSQIDSDSNAISMGGVNYLVGDKALRNHYPTRSYSALERIAPLLVHKALMDAKIDLDSEKLDVTIGLSLLNFKDKASQYGERIKTTEVNGKALINSLANNKLTIKPQGVSMNSQLQGLAIYIDIGFNTVDVIVVDDGAIVRDSCYANANGTHKIVEQLQNYLIATYQLAITELLTNQYLHSGYVVVAGEKQSLTHIIEGLKHEYSFNLLASLEAKDFALWQQADHIIFGGGGANLIELPSQSNMRKAKDAEWVNVI